MEEQSIFRNISPLDHRYSLANEELFTRLRDYLSEDASVRYGIEAEKALLKAHIDEFFEGSEDLKRAVDDAAKNITPARVYEEEEKTKHNVRALVNVLKRFVPRETAPYVHLGATSVDILDTAAAARYRDAMHEVVLPLLIDLEKLLIDLAYRYRKTPQTGRTHGQHAVPITFGFALSEYVARLGKSIGVLKQHADNLRGKLAGAVGAYNATSLLVRDPEAFERRYLGYLGLEPSEHSTQMVEPEYLLRLLTELNTAFGIIGNLADDLRHLQRSEIAEVQEFFSAAQVGSSTMPQKRNPWNSEHVKSLWKAYSPRVVTFYMDQISEHQRDLTNSASSRFIAEFIAGFSAAAERMRRILESLHVHEDALDRNLSRTGEFLLAEAAYVLLSTSGLSDAHETVRKATLRCEEEGISLSEALESNQELWKLLEEGLARTLGMGAKEFFSRPENYRGRAVEKTEEITGTYRRIMEELTEELS
jgi:adenylosuccinate lyase